MPKLPTLAYSSFKHSSEQPCWHNTHISHPYQDSHSAPHFTCRLALALNLCENVWWFQIAAFLHCIYGIFSRRLVTFPANPFFKSRKTWNSFLLFARYFSSSNSSEQSPDPPTPSSLKSPPSVKLCNHSFSPIYWYLIIFLHPHHPLYISILQPSSCYAINARSLSSISLLYCFLYLTTLHVPCDMSVLHWIYSSSLQFSAPFYTANTNS